MRLIDADKFEAFMYQNDNDDFDNGVQFVLEIIDKAPTVCDIDAIRAEIDFHATTFIKGKRYIEKDFALDIIDKHFKGA